MRVPPGLCAHVRWARFLVLGLWSRRLTEPPRPMRSRERTPPPACGGHLPFQGRRCSGSLQKFPSAEGAFWIAHTSLNVSQRWQVAAALSAAVTITKQQGTAPTPQAEPSQKKHPTQTPAALRERGSGGEALLSEKRPLPQPPSCRKVAAALSAAVTITKQQGTAPTPQAESTMQKSTRQTPAALREKGSGEEGLLSEKPPPPQNLPHRNLFGREREGGGFSEEKPPPSHISLRA